MLGYTPTEKGLMAHASELQDAYEDIRADWAESIGRPYPKRRRKIKPPPGSVDLIDEELG